jgi:hypothetical protein
VVPRFAGHGQGLRPQPGQAASPELSAPDGFAAYIKTGIERWAMIKKIRAPLK